MLAGLIIFAIPSLLTVLAAYLFYKGLANREKPDARCIIPALVILLIPCIALFLMFVVGWLIAAIGFFLFFYTSLTAVICGIFLLILVPGWRKAWGGVTLILYPGLMFLSIISSGPFNWTTYARKQADPLVKALETYRARTGMYPDSLDQLVPADIPALPEQNAIGGWLYRSTGNEYQLGYAGNPDEFGYPASVYSSRDGKWDYKTFWENPFRYIIPTTTPTFTAVWIEPTFTPTP